MKLRLAELERQLDSITIKLPGHSHENYYINQLYTVILLIIMLNVGVLIDNKAFVCLFVVNQ